MRLIQREGYKILDVRSARDYDDKHITKPAKSSLNAPVVMNDNSTPNSRFLDEVCTGLRCYLQLCTAIAARNLQLMGWCLTLTRKVTSSSAPAVPKLLVQQEVLSDSAVGLLLKGTCSVLVVS